MDLNDLRARGVFASSPPVRKEVTWQPTDPVNGAPVGEPLIFDVFIKRPSAGWLDRARTDAALSKSGVSFRNAVIAHAILWGDKQDQRILYEEAEVMPDSLAAALWDAYLAVNAPPPPPNANAQAEEEFAKNLEPTPGSGMNSSEPASAAAA